MKSFSCLWLVVAACVWPVGANGPYLVAANSGSDATSAQGQGAAPLAATNGYITAVLRSGCTSAPTPPPPVGETVVGPDYVIMTVANGDPLDYENAQQVVTDAIFASLMPLYCGLPRGGCITNRVQWNILTYDSAGNPRISGGPLSGHGFHYCQVTNGYITAVLRSECTSAPTPPPSVGGIVVGPDYVIMTVADADPLDYPGAQQFATDAVFQSLMPLYCALAESPRRGCVAHRVQWNLLTYDAGGNPKVSGGPVSGPAFHYFDSCSLTPQEQIQNLMIWVQVNLAAGILGRGDSRRLTGRLNAALRHLAHGNDPKAVDNLERFHDDVDSLVKRERLPLAAAQPLIDGALAIVAQL